MSLRNAPYYIDFTFDYKGVSIYVPASLNKVARSKPNTFWDWLLFKHSFESYIILTHEHIIEEKET
jgi:hypothetical protein